MQYALMPNSHERVELRSDGCFWSAGLSSDGLRDAFRRLCFDSYAVGSPLAMTTARCGCVVGRFGGGTTGFGRKHHTEHAAFHDRFLFKPGVLGDAFGNASQHIHSDLRVCLFASSESYEDLHFGAVLEELEDALGLLRDVVIGDLGGEPDFFELAGSPATLFGPPWPVWTGRI